MTRIARASLIIAFFFTLDKGLAFIKSLLFTRIAGLEGVGILGASNNIPDYLSALISGGALGIAIIPVLSETLDQQGRRATWDLFSHILNLAFLVTAGLSVLIILFADPLVRVVIAPGFTPDKQTLTASLMRLDLLAITFFSISGLVMAGLQANQHFLFPAMAPVFYNLGQIGGALILAPESGLHLGPVTLPAFGLGLYGIVYGVILGAMLHLLIQVPGLLRYEFHWTPSIDLRSPGVIRVLTLLGPRVVTMAFIQAYYIARDNLSSHFGEAGVGALNLGWFIQQIPETIIGTAIAIALLPSLSEYIARGQRHTFRLTVNRALRGMLALGLPVAALLAADLRPLVDSVFGLAGIDMTPEGLNLMIWCTWAFLLGLVGDTWLEVAVRSFYAQQNVRVPLIAAALQSVAFILVASLLSRLVGLPGIALAAAITFTGQALFLLFLLNRRFPGLLNVGGTLARAVPAAGLGALAILAWLRFVPLPALLLALSAILLGGLVTVPFIWPEVKLLIKLGEAENRDLEGKPSSV